MSLRDELREIIANISLRERTPEGFSDDLNQMERKALDSLAIMQLITPVQNSCRIEPGKEDVTPEYFASVAHWPDLLKVSRLDHSKS